MLVLTRRSFAGSEENRSVQGPHRRTYFDTPLSPSRMWSGACVFTASFVHIIAQNLRSLCRDAQVFVDFEGCLALQCSRCPCKFCGWCLRDCGDRDAHPHVKKCTLKPHSRINDPYFCSFQEFEDFQRLRRWKTRQSARA